MGSLSYFWLGLLDLLLGLLDSLLALGSLLKTNLLDDQRLRLDLIFKLLGWRRSNSSLLGSYFLDECPHLIDNLERIVWH